MNGPNARIKPALGFTVKPGPRTHMQRRDIPRCWSRVRLNVACKTANNGAWSGL